MAIFVTVLVLALWIFSVFSLSLPNEILPAPFHVNVTTGGFLDDLPECSRTCSLAFLEYTRCAPADQACICANADISYQLDRCLDMYCSVIDYYAGEYSIHIACDTAVRNRSYSITRTVTATAIISFLAVCVRLATRISPFSIKWGADDWVVIGITPLAACQLALLLTMVHYGFGQDIYMLSPTTIATAAKYWYLSELNFVILTFSTKIAILCFYLRLFPTGSIRSVTYLLITICATAMLAVFLAHLFQCLPLSYRWRMYLDDGTTDSANPPICKVDRQALNYTFSILNLGIEVVVITLPIPRLLKLQVQWWRKIEVVSIFTFGFVVTVIAIMRLVITLTAHYTWNFTYEVVPVSFWCAIEIYISIFIVCLPQVYLVGKSITQRCYKSNRMRIDTTDEVPLSCGQSREQ